MQRSLLRKAYWQAVGTSSRRQRWSLRGGRANSVHQGLHVRRRSTKFVTEEGLWLARNFLISVQPSIMPARRGFHGKKSERTRRRKRLLTFHDSYVKPHTVIEKEKHLRFWPSTVDTFRAGRWFYIDDSTAEKNSRCSADPFYVLFHRSSFSFHATKRDRSINLFVLFTNVSVTFNRSTTLSLFVFHWILIESPSIRQLPSLLGHSIVFHNMYFNCKIMNELLRFLKISQACRI